MVMSSVRTSNRNHCRYDSATTVLHASRGCSAPSNFATKSTTIWDVRNSQTPSEANTMKAVLSSMLRMRGSGSAKTPIFSATWSPMERVKAQPGLCMLLSQTLGGSPFSSSSSPRFMPQFSWIGSKPSIWSIVMTTAPHFFTLSLSSFLNGVWSMLKCSALRPPPGIFMATTARESPTLFTNMSQPRIMTVMAVVPDSSVSKFCLPISLLLFTKAFL
mmetsp:Transcript_7047/g.14675  ORF Transcript_7047/g.14675 Transcript_7047/m.14675 type:complete len:217 (-) Transcript_7047:166-816(-)